MELICSSAFGFALPFVLLLLTQAHAQGLCAEKVTPHGFSCTEHSVTTDDGFVLALQNIGATGAAMPTRGLSARKLNGNYGRRYSETRGSRYLRVMFLENDTAPNLSPSQESFSPSQTSDSTLTSTPGPTFIPTPTSASIPTPTPPPPATPSSISSPHSPTSASIPATTPAPTTPKSAGIVFLLHPPLVAGDFWLQSFGTQGIEQCLPFILSQSGYDVWIANLRATIWSHANIRLSSDERAYWNWSWDELAQYDLPALLNYVVDRTSAPINSIHVISYGINNAVALASATTNDVSSRLATLTMISPAVYLGNVNSTFLEAWAWVTGPAIDSFMVGSGISNGAYNASGAFSQIFDPDSESGRSILSDVFGTPCCIPINALQGYSFGANGWDGTTPYKNLQHIQQMIRLNAFARYQESSESSLQPYDPSALASAIRVLLVYGGRDPVGTSRNVDELASRFGSTSRLSRVYLPQYAHFDLCFSTSVVEDVFLPIMRFLEGENSES